MCIRDRLGRILGVLGGIAGGIAGALLYMYIYGIVDTMDNSTNNIFWGMLVLFGPIGILLLALLFLYAFSGQKMRKR